MDYEQFLATKHKTVGYGGFDVAPERINPMLFPFQRDIVRWALKLGKAAIFAECGLGKTPMQLEYAKQVVQYTGGKAIIVAPLAVAHQTVSEGKKFGVDVKYCKSADDIGDAQIIITNYDRLHLFSPEMFVCVVLDESSILKSLQGKIRTALIEMFQRTPYKLACTATPAPNDHVELGNHAEFLNMLSSAEMLATWFVNDASETRNWRLKGHAAKDFWRWLTSWAVCLSRPSDLGAQYDMPNFELPPLNLVEHRLKAPQISLDKARALGKLIPDDNPSGIKLHEVKRDSLVERVQCAVEIAASMPESELISIWCDTNDEADALMLAFPDAIEVRGNHTSEQKEYKINLFSDSKVRMIITKSSITGFGLNWQHNPNQIHIGIGYSFEKMYQAIRRSHRFGQKQQVNVHVIYAETEGSVMHTITEKQKQFKEMQGEMNEAMREHGLFRDDKKRITVVDSKNVANGNDYTLYHGDCVEVSKTLPDNSIDLSVFSLPFSDMFAYNDSIQDMGNSRDDKEFFKHYKFLIPELYRITKPGRLCVVHCSDLPNFKYKHGVVSIRDFPGEIIRAHVAAGWEYHSRVTIWKNPVVEMQRTKAHSLLHKTFAASAEATRQGLPDYLVVFRKWPVEGADPVIQKREVGDYVGTNPPDIVNGSKFDGDKSYSIGVWQNYASPVWFDIDQTNTLNVRQAKDDKDLKHICPLQLDVIERCIDLWTNKGDTVFSPFAGIGSEPYSAIKMGRKAIGIELKESYWKTSIKNCQQAEIAKSQRSLFDLMDEMSANGS